VTSAGKTVKDIMSKDVYIVSPEDTLAHVRKIFISKDIGRVLVYDEKPVGIVSERDMSRAFMEERRSIDEIPVRDVMKKNLVAIRIDNTPEQAAKLMVDKGVSGLPVIGDNKNIVGIVTKTNLAKYFSKNYADEIPVSDIMNRRIKTVKEFQSIFHAARLMQDYDVDRLVIMDGKRAKGVISDRDLSMASLGLKPKNMSIFTKSKGGLDRKNVRVRHLIVADLMKTELIKAKPTEDAAETAKRMIKNDVGSALVEERGRLAGIVTKTSYAEWLAKQA